RRSGPPREGHRIARRYRRGRHRGRSVQGHLVRGDESGDQIHHAVRAARRGNCGDDERPGCEDRHRGVLLRGRAGVRLSLVLLHADSGRKSGRQVTAGFSPPPSGPRREGGFVFGSAGGAKDNSPRRKPWVIVWWGISPGWGKRKVVVQLFLSLLAELEPLVSQTHGLT